MNPERPDPATAAAVIGSLRVITSGRRRFATTYREVLVASVPRDHPLRRHGDDATLAALIESLLWGVGQGQEHPDEVESAWQELGAWLAGRGVPAAACGALGHVLVRAVRDVSGDAWSASLSSGWAAYHLWMLHHLAVGAATVPPVPEPPAPSELPPPADRGRPDAVRTAVASPTAAARTASEAYQALGRGWL